MYNVSKDRLLVLPSPCASSHGQLYCTGVTVVMITSIVAYLCDSMAMISAAVQVLIKLCPDREIRISPTDTKMWPKSSLNRFPSMEQVLVSTLRCIVGHD